MYFIHIRPAKLEDTQALGDVEVEVWRDTYPDVLPVEFLTKTLDPTLCAARWQRRIRRERSWPPLVVLTGEPKTVVAYATAGPSRINNLPTPYAVEIYELYVKPDEQGQGIGRRLCEAIAERALTKGLESLCVEVLEKNTNRFFYEALGGRLAARRDHPFAGTTLPSCIYGWPDVRTLTRLAAH